MEGARGTPRRGGSDAWRTRSPNTRRGLGAPTARSTRRGSKPGRVRPFAERARCPVGYALVTIGEGSQGWVAGEQVADVETLSVLPENRGRGVGSQLMDAVELEVVRLGISELRLLVVARTPRRSASTGAVRSRRSARSCSAGSAVGRRCQLPVRPVLPSRRRAKVCSAASCTCDPTNRFLVKPPVGRPRRANHLPK